jgi:hypothetical protein
MIDWISRNHQIVSIALNFAMLLVWIAYLQVFVSSYWRQTRAHILLTMGSGSTLSSRCLVGNMSSAAIYVHSIVLDLELANRRVTCAVTDPDGLEEWQEPTELGLWTRQGPLQPGCVRDMGAFDTMLGHALRSEAGGDSPDAAVPGSLRGFSVRIIASYASEDLPVAAERSFEVVRSDAALRLRPSAAQARQIRSRRQRRRIGEELRGQASDSRP